MYPLSCVLPEKASRPRTLSLSGPLRKPATVVSSSSVSYPALKFAANVGVGLRVGRVNAPPTVFLPNRVPCGPRRTSTRSMSQNAKRLCTPRPRFTPSTNVDTDCSRLAISPVKIPRMLILSPIGSCVTVKFGTSVASSSRLSIPVSSIVLPDTVEIEIGTSCSVSVRARAVTITSSITSSSCPYAVTTVASDSPCSSNSAPKRSILRVVFTERLPEVLAEVECRRRCGSCWPRAFARTVPMGLHRRDRRGAHSTAPAGTKRRQALETIVNLAGNSLVGLHSKLELARCSRRSCKTCGWQPLRQLWCSLRAGGRIRTVHSSRHLQFRFER